MNIDKREDPGRCNKPVCGIPCLIRAILMGIAGIIVGAVVVWRFSSVQQTIDTQVFRVLSKIRRDVKATKVDVKQVKSVIVVPDTVAPTAMTTTDQTPVTDAAKLGNVPIVDVKPIQGETATSTPVVPIASIATGPIAQDTGMKPGEAVPTSPQQTQSTSLPVTKSSDVTQPAIEALQTGTATPNAPVTATSEAPAAQVAAAPLSTAPAPAATDATKSATIAQTQPAVVIS